MYFQYALDERPPIWKLVLFGLQWAAIAVPSVITVGRAIDSFHGTESPSAFGYLQRLLLVTAITLVGQVLVGHRLPVIAGPATVLLIGVLGLSGVLGVIGPVNYSLSATDAGSPRLPDQVEPASVCRTERSLRPVNCVLMTRPPYAEPRPASRGYDRQNAGVVKVILQVRRSPSPPPTWADRSEQRLVQLQRVAGPFNMT